MAPKTAIYMRVRTQLLCRFSGARADWTTRLRQNGFLGFRLAKS